MIKIKELKVKNFKSLIDTHIEEFDTVNMFYGFNNSGKSNVFKFLNILFTKKKELQVVTSIEEDGNLALAKKSKDTLVNTADFWNGHLYDEPYIFSNNDRSNNINFEVTIEISNDLLPKLQLLKDNGFIAEGETTNLILNGLIKSINSKDSKLEVSSASLNNKNFHLFDDEIHYGFKDLGITGLDAELASNILNILNDLIEFIDTDRNFIKEIFNDESIELNNHNFKNWLFELNMNAEKNDTFQGLAKFLSDFEFSTDGKTKLSNNINSFPFREFTDIGFTRFGNEIEIMLKNNTNRLPLSSFGTGIQQFFFILTRIFMNNSKVIIIEEIELNLSPLYQKELLLFVKSLIGIKFDQLIFSTHSPFFTLKDHALIDLVQHVQIGNSALDSGSKVETHRELHYDDANNMSFLSWFYS